MPGCKKLRGYQVISDACTAAGTVATCFSFRWLFGCLSSFFSPTATVSTEGPLDEAASQGILSGALGKARDAVASNPVKVAAGVLACAAGAGVYLAARSGTAKSESEDSSDKSRCNRKKRKAKTSKKTVDSGNTYVFAIVAVLLVVSVLLLYCFCFESDEHAEELVPDIENGLFRQA